MRKIKFRGKRIANGEWVYGSLLVRKSEPTAQIYDGKGWADVYPETVGQYTGMTDHKGTPVYEGDIIEEKGLEFTRCKVLHVCGGFLAYQLDMIIEPKEAYACIETFWYYVVGNIHDNPEMTKKR